MAIIRKGEQNTYRRYTGITGPWKDVKHKT